MKRRARLLAVLTLAAFTLAACLEGIPGFEDPALLSAEERQIRKIEQQRLTQSIGIGCLVGSASGLLLGNDEDRKQNILLGTAVGCAVGFAAGQYINTRSAQFSNSQQHSRALIAAADKDIQQYRSLNSTTRSLVSQQRSKVAKLNREFSAGTISSEGYRTQISSAGKNLRTLENQSKAMNDQINVMKTDAGAIRSNGGSSSAINQRISSLESEKRQLDSQRRALANIYDDVPPAVNLNL